MIPEVRRARVRYNGFKLRGFGDGGGEEEEECELRELLELAKLLLVLAKPAC